MHTCEFSMLSSLSMKNVLIKADVYSKRLNHEMNSLNSCNYSFSSSLASTSERVTKKNSLQVKEEIK